MDHLVVQTVTLGNVHCHNHGFVHLIAYHTAMSRLRLLGIGLSLQVLGGEFTLTQYR